MECQRPVNCIPDTRHLSPQPLAAHLLQEVRAHLKPTPKLKCLPSSPSVHSALTHTQASPPPNLPRSRERASSSVSLAPSLGMRGDVARAEGQGDDECLPGRPRLFLDRLLSRAGDAFYSRPAFICPTVIMNKPSLR
jgi:hypothetical protein